MYLITSLRIDKAVKDRWFCAGRSTSTETLLAIWTMFLYTGRSYIWFIKPFIYEMSEAICTCSNAWGDSWKPDRCLIPILTLLAQTHYSNRSLKTHHVSSNKILRHPCLWRITAVYELSNEGVLKPYSNSPPRLAHRNSIRSLSLGPLAVWPIPILASCLILINPRLYVLITACQQSILPSATPPRIPLTKRNISSA